MKWISLHFYFSAPRKSDIAPLSVEGTMLREPKKLKQEQNPDSVAIRNLLQFFEILMEWDRKEKDEGRNLRQGVE